MYFYLLELKQKCTKIYVKETFFCEKGFHSSRFWRKCVFFQNIQAEAFFFAKRTIFKNQTHGIQSAENIFSFWKVKRPGVSVFCASKQVKSLESDRKCVFCTYRNSNKQFSRNKTLLKAWIRQEYCVKPLTSEFKGLNVPQFLSF